MGRWCMPLFGRKKQKQGAADAAVEHAVLLHYALSDDEFGDRDEREDVFALGERLEAAIGAARAGELDGNEFGDGEVVIYLYGPDKDRLWAAVESVARAFPARPAHALLRAGGPEVEPDRIDL